jgi:hypothetical protein
MGERESEIYDKFFATREDDEYIINARKIQSQSPT